MQEESVKRILPFFFIIGRPRSGTTLLSTLLDAHPNVCIPFECSLLINLFPKYGKVKTWSEQKLSNFHHDVINHRKFKTWRVDNDQLLSRFMQCPHDTSFHELIQLVYLSFQSFFLKQEIQIIGDKNPIYSFYTSRLMEIKPDAKFIYLSRDYRDHILSMKKIDFEAPVTPLLAQRWKIAAKHNLTLLKKSPDNTLFVRYEDLVKDPKTMLKTICSFINIPFSEEMLDIQRIRAKIQDNFGKEAIDRYHSSLLKPIDDSKIGLWKKDMSEKDIFISDIIVGNYAEKHAYERKYKSRFSPGILMNLPWIFYAMYSIRLRKLTDYFPHNIKLAIRNRGPVLAHIFNKLIKK